MSDTGALVIIDGPDAVGKTTFARYLLGADFNRGYIHLGLLPDKELWRAQYFALIKASLRLSRGELTVIDRHWMSEQIYARTYRNLSGLSAEARMWDRVVRRMCGVYVMAVPSVDSAVQRHAVKSQVGHEMFAPSIWIKEVALRFLHLWWGGYAHAIPVDYVQSVSINGGMCNRDDAIRYDIDSHGHDLDSVAARLYDRLLTLRQNQYPAALDYSQRNFLGNLGSAKYVFVGERINPNKSGRWPFVDHGFSSATVSNALQDINFNECDGVWTNAIAKDQHLEAILKIKPSLKVVAFGHIAACDLHRRGIEFQSVMHPAHARRFGQTQTFTAQLREVLK